MGAANSTSSLGLLLPDLNSPSSLHSPDGEANPTTFPRSHAALTLQKAYRGYRTRRRLADSAVLAEELWWKVIDYARLNHSTISFFNFDKPESAASRWHRVLLNASKVGQGLSKDAKAQKLAFQHWIEAIDPRHRYGHNLHIYYEEWCKTDSEEPFFFWLDIGDGRDVDLKDCPRSKLRSQCIKYLGPQEREHYEYILVDGKILHKQSQDFLDTTGSPVEKWIFVVSTSHKLYAGVKKKGAFHHSSFLAGGATLAAGRLIVQEGILKSISPYSGHYRPTNDSLDSFLLFLKDNGLNLDEVQIVKANEDSDIEKGDNPTTNDLHEPETLDTKLSTESDGAEEEEKNEEPPTNTKKAAREELIRYLRSDQISLDSAPRNLEPQLSRKWSTKSVGLPSPMTEVPKHAILERINSKKATGSYQLGRQLSRKWSTGAGPRIGCVNDYPPELKQQALEIVNLSPGRPSATSSASAIFSTFYGMASPSFRPRVL